MDEVALTDCDYSSFLGEELNYTLDIQLFNGKGNGDQTIHYKDEMTLITEIDEITNLSIIPMKWELILSFQEIINDALRVVEEKLFGEPQTDRLFNQLMWNILNARPTYDFFREKLTEIIGSPSAQYASELWKTFIYIQNM